MYFLLFFTVWVTPKFANANDLNCIKQNVGVQSDCQGDSYKCVGLATALHNATTCSEFFEPSYLGCKNYVTDGHSQSEWLAVAKTYYDKLSDCLSGDPVDYNGDDGSKSIGLNDQDIVNNAVSGEDFFNVVLGSPFARKLSISDLSEIQSALGETTAVNNPASPAPSSAPATP